MSSFVIICHLLFATWQTTADVGHDPSWIILCLLAKRAQHHWQYFKTWSPLIVDWCLCDRTGRLTGQRLRSMSSWRRRSLELRLTVPPSASSRRKTSWSEEEEVHFGWHLTDSPFSGPSRWKDQATGAKCGRASRSDVGTFTTKLFQLPECPETRFYIVFQ